MTGHEQQQQPQAAQQDALDAAVAETQKRLMQRPEILAMRMENESIMSECRVRPRNMQSIKAELREQLEAFPAMAEGSIYNKPVGKDDKGEMQYASGLSIRAAEVLAEAYGFNRVRSDVSPLDADTVKVEASFTDYQKGRIWQDGGILSKKYKTRGGGTRTHNDDRFFNVVVKAELSKRVREVIMRSVNAGLKAWFENECREVMGKVLTDDKVKEIISQFQATYDMSLKQIELIVGRPVSMGWTAEERQKLAGIWAALRDNETTVAEILGVAYEESGGAPPQPGEPPAAAKTDPSAQADALADELVGRLKTPTPEEPKPEQPKEPAQETRSPEHAKADAILEKAVKDMNPKRSIDSVCGVADGALMELHELGMEQHAEQLKAERDKKVGRLRRAQERREAESKKESSQEEAPNGDAKDSANSAATEDNEPPVGDDGGTGSGEGPKGENLFF